MTHHHERGRMQMRKVALALAIALTTAGLTACGSNDKKSSSSGSTTHAGTTTAPAGKAATGTPITVGFLNQEKGAVAFPDFGSGARVARDYLNSQLDGIGGHPLRFVECQTDGSPETSIDCANRFAEQHVAAVLEGIDFGSDATIPVLKSAGIPLVGHTAFGVAQSIAPNAFFFGAALPAYGVAPLAVMKDQLHAKSAVYLGSDTPLIHGFVKGAIAPAAQKAGIALTSIFYPATNPNFASTLTSALAKKPDVIFTTGSEPDCIGIVKAASTLSFQGKLFAGSCSAFIQADGKAAEGVYSSSDLWVTEAADRAPAAKAQQVATYVAQMKAHAPKYVAGFAQDTFSSTMDLAAILKTVKGPVTPKSVTAALHATTGLDSFMGQSLTCDGKQWPGQPSACANGLIVYRVQGGKRVPATNGFLHATGLVGAS
jgi:branched-chain amino acid transport system substrate-binding protein